MTKNEIITRLCALSGELGREIDTTGTLAELELRLREVEEECSVIRDDALISEDAIPSGPSVVYDEGETLKIKVKPGLWCLHLRVLTARGWLPTLVSPGSVAVIAGREFDTRTMIKGG